VKDELHRDLLRDPIAKPWPEFVATFLETKTKRRSTTVARYRLSLRNFERLCNPANVAAVTPLMIEMYVVERSNEVAPATVNSDLRHLRAALEKARIWYNLPSNPVDQVERVEVPEKELRVLGAGEVETLLATCQGIPDHAHACRWEAFIYLAVTCGLRRGELVNLRWQDLDLEKYLVKIVNQECWRTKSGKNRAAFLDDHAVALFQKLRDATASRMRVSPYVFASDNGERWGSNLSRDFQWLVKRSGLCRFTLHDLRRTFCSALANANVQEAVVQQLAGHAAIATTLQYYTKITSDTARKAAQALPYRRGSTTPDSRNAGNTPDGMKDVS
jgi:integrase